MSACVVSGCRTSPEMPRLVCCPETRPGGKAKHECFNGGADPATTVRHRLEDDPAKAVV